MLCPSDSATQKAVTPPTAFRDTGFGSAAATNFRGVDRSGLKPFLPLHEDRALCEEGHSAQSVPASYRLSRAILSSPVDEARNVHALQAGPGERRSFHPCPDLLGSVFLTEVEQHS
jgi:hypothetical protein